MYKEPPSEVWNGFALAASEAGLSISDIAYVVDVDAPESTGPATITMTVGESWVDSQGGPDNIKIFRYNPDDGTYQVLETTYTGPEDGVYTFTATSTEGLSIFGLGATYTPPVAEEGGGIAWIAGPIVGGIAIVLLAVWLLRRRARAGI